MLKRLALGFLGVVAATAASAAVAPPLPPASYTVPAGTYVSNATQFAAELAKSAHTIILNDGVYSKTSPWTINKGHKIYAAHVRGATLTAGLNVTAANVTLQGFNVNITNGLYAVKTSGNDLNWTTAIELVAGSSRNAHLYDLTLTGNKVVGTGIDARQPEGLQIQRLSISGYRTNGIYADADQQNLTVTSVPVISDLLIQRVSRPVPRSSDGTAESCFWLGYTAKVDRLKLRDCAWMGVWTGTSAKNVTMSDVDIDNTQALLTTKYNGVGIYFEHFTTNSIFQRFKIGGLSTANMMVGAVCEWDDPNWGGIPACNGVVLQDAVIKSSCAGAWFDEGTKNSTVRRTTFIGQQRAALVTYGPLNGTWYDLSGNVYQMAPGAVVRLDDGNPCDWTR